MLGDLMSLYHRINLMHWFQGTAMLTRYKKHRCANLTIHNFIIALVILTDTVDNETVFRSIY